MSIDLEELAVHGGAIGILLQRFLENFLGLRVASVGHVDVRFGDRIDLLGFHAGGRLARGLGARRAA